MGTDIRFPRSGRGTELHPPPSVRPRTGIGSTQCELPQAHPLGIGGVMAVKEMSPSADAKVASSGAGAKCMLCELFDVCPPGFWVYVMLAIDHPTSEVSATCFRESISRPIITERYLWVGLL